MKERKRERDKFKKKLINDSTILVLRFQQSFLNFIFLFFLV